MLGEYEVQITATDTYENETKVMLYIKVYAIVNLGQQPVVE